jgi:hypothetical protein
MMLGGGGGAVNHAYSPDEEADGGRGSREEGGGEENSRITGSLHSDSSSPLPTKVIFISTTYCFIAITKVTACG